MDTCQQCRQLKARIACLEAYLDSLGMPLPTAADAVGLRNLPPIDPPITENPKRRDTLGHRVPGNQLPPQQQRIATPDEKIAIVDCVD